MAGRMRRMVDRIWSLPVPVNYLFLVAFLIGYLLFIVICTIISLVVALVFYVVVWWEDGHSETATLG